MVEQQAMQVLFGPVPSRRLGLSLGVDVVPWKVCTFDCLYCEVGRTTRLTLERGEYVSEQRITDELRRFFSAPDAGAGLDYVTFSGSGEPTLHAGLGRLIALIKQLTTVPVAVLTNGALLGDPAVQEELRQADLVIPSLDAASQAVFERINRPSPGMRIERIVQGQVEFRRKFPGALWLEVLFVAGINDAEDEVRRLAAAAARIAPDKVQLTSVVRPPGAGFAPAVSGEWLSSIAGLFPGAVEVVAEFDRAASARLDAAPLERLEKMLRIRPVTLDELCATLGLRRVEALKQLDLLKQRGALEQTEFDGRIYYTIDKRRQRKDDDGG